MDPTAILITLHDLTDDELRAKVDLLRKEIDARRSALMRAKGEVARRQSTSLGDVCREMLRDGFLVASFDVQVCVVLRLNAADLVRFNADEERLRLLVEEGRQATMGGIPCHVRWSGLELRVFPQRYMDPDAWATLFDAVGWRPKADDEDVREMRVILDALDEKRGLNQ